MSYESPISRKRSRLSGYAAERAMNVKGEPGRQYHLVNLGKSARTGHPLVGLVESNARDQILLQGENYAGSPFWQALLDADIVWTERGGSYRRYYEYNPQRAEKIRKGE